MNSITKSHELHETIYNRHKQGAELYEHGLTWLQDNTVDSWRHKRMYETINPLLSNYPDAEWVTIGDGRYGNDAYYISQKGIKVLATDICDTLLEKAKKLGRLSEYKKENAENLSFKDGQFDFALCKEAYHHFPRPMLALYEMLRVTKEGVVLIEPNDPCYVCHNPAKFWEVVTKYNHFEEINYVYTISARELIKVAIGIGLPTIAFKGFNDSYIKGVEYEKLSEDSELFKKIKEGIEEQDRKCEQHLQSYGRFTAIIFKKQPNEAARTDLVNQGFNVIDLPQNPNNQ